jgi:hypothetical protein
MRSRRTMGLLVRTSQFVCYTNVQTSSRSTESGGQLTDQLKRTPLGSGGHDDSEVRRLVSFGPKHMNTNALRSGAQQREAASS